MTGYAVVRIGSAASGTASGGRLADAGMQGAIACSGLLLVLALLLVIDGLSQVVSTVSAFSQS